MKTQAILLASRPQGEPTAEQFQYDTRETPALTRQFPDYAALVASEEFEGWCETLYRPLINAPWRSLSSTEANA